MECKTIGMMRWEGMTGPDGLGDDGVSVMDRNGKNFNGIRITSIGFFFTKIKSATWRILHNGCLLVHSRRLLINKSI